MAFNVFRFFLYVLPGSCPIGPLVMAAGFPRADQTVMLALVARAGQADLFFLTPSSAPRCRLMKSFPDGSQAAHLRWNLCLLQAPPGAGKQQRVPLALLEAVRESRGTAARSWLHCTEQQAGRWLSKSRRPNAWAGKRLKRDGWKPEGWSTGLPA